MCRPLARDQRDDMIRAAFHGSDFLQLLSVEQPGLLSSDLWRLLLLVPDSEGASHLERGKLAVWGWEDAVGVVDDAVGLFPELPVDGPGTPRHGAVLLAGANAGRSFFGEDGGMVGSHADTGFFVRHVVSLL